MNKKYFVIELNAIQQFESKVLFGSIKYKDVNLSSKVSARNKSEDEFQREPQQKDYGKIKSFIKERLSKKHKEKLPIFPTPLILDVNIEMDFYVNNNIIDIEKYFENQYNTYLEFKMLKKELNHLKDTEFKEKIEELESRLESYPKFKGLIFEKTKNEKYDLYVPLFEENFELNPILIVDGQHRFLGLKEFFKETDSFTINHQPEDFNFLVTYLITNDMYEQAIIFSDVNFNQKPVNKSLMYDILSVVPFEKNQALFSHFIVKRFNENEEFEGIVKMLGIGTGIISLAFMVETIKDKLLTKSCPKLLEIYENDYLKENGDRHKKIPDIFIDYFKFIKINFSKYFPEKNKQNEYNVKDYNSILFKTTGIYALLLVFKDLINNYDLDFYKYKENEFNKILEIAFKEIIEEQPKLFNENSRYSKAGSAGLQRDLYLELNKLLILPKKE